MWAHSAAAGAWAREIARQRRPNVEGAFLCGLLHDVGRPVMVQAVVDTERTQERPLRRARDPAGDGRVARAGGRHAGATLGAARLDGERHRLASRAPAAATEHVDEARTTALADRLAHWLIDEAAAEPELLRGLPLVAELGIYPDELDALLGPARRPSGSSPRRFA